MLVSGNAVVVENPVAVEDVVGGVFEVDVFHVDVADVDVVEVVEGVDLCKDGRTNIRIYCGLLIIVL